MSLAGSKTEQNLKDAFTHSVEPLPENFRLALMNDLG